MADYINNVGAGDKYSDALTVGPDFTARSAVISVFNSPALMQFAVGELGSWHWTDEREFFSVPQSFKVAGIIGVKFRNANAGEIARILCTLSGPDDIQFESGLPNAGTLTAGGSFNPQGVVTGHVSAAGAVIAGSGFNASRLGVGNYQLVWNPQLGATPVVLAVGDNSTGTAIVCDTANNSAIQVQVLTWNDAGALVDSGFYFTATPIS